MSANKTIKALRDERDELHAEIRRLQAKCGEQPTFAQMVRDAKQDQARKADGQKYFPTDIKVTSVLMGHNAADRRVISADQSLEPGQVRMGYSFLEHQARQMGIDLNAVKDCGPSGMGMHMKGIYRLRSGSPNLSDSLRRELVGEFLTTGPDWRQAPPDATHVLQKYHIDSAIWLKLSDKPHEPAYRWNRTTFAWVKAYRDTAEALESEYVTPRPLPAPPQSFIEMHLHRGAQSLVSRIDIRGDVSLSQVYHTATDALHCYGSGEPHHKHADMTVAWNSPFVNAGESFHVAPAEPAVKGGNNGVVTPWYDWEDAPEDATHAITGTPSLWMKLTEGETAYFWRESFGEKDGHWKDSGHPSSLYIGSAHVVARPAPEEIWSLDGQNGNWDYTTLAELIKEHYGHMSDDNGSGLFVGHTVFRANVCKDDPAKFLPDADKITEHMWDMACMSDAGEWVDAYPELKTEGAQALDKALAPLKRWARQYCQPDFFTVRDITEVELTADMVREAGVHQQVFE